MSKKTTKKAAAEAAAVVETPQKRGPGRPRRPRTPEELAAEQARAEARQARAERKAAKEALPKRGPGRPRLHKRKNRMMGQTPDEFLAMGDKFIKLNAKMTMGAIAEKFDMEVSAVFQRISVARAPEAVRAMILNGAVTPTSVIPALNKKKSDAQIVREVKAMAKIRREGKALLDEGQSKVTLKRRLESAREQIDALVASKELKGTRAKTIAAFMEALLSERSVTSIVESAKSLA
jgi:hypothetical protein